MATFLPQEMVEEIMSWLPPESLIRFKCVCKSWYTLIETLIHDSSFVAKHLGNISNKILSSKTSTSLLLRYTTRKNLQEPKYDEITSLLTFYGDHGGGDDDNDDSIPCATQDLYLPHDVNLSIKMVFHCNGIFCLVDPKINVILLCNPALREYKFVPSSCLVDRIRLLAVGFGYDSRTSNYKVIVVKHLSQAESHYSAELYTLSTNSWRDVTENTELEFYGSPHKVVYCKGVCYWFSLFRRYMISFDFHEEVFRRILLPDKINHLANYRNIRLVLSKIVVWNESVALLFYHEVVPVVIDMWMMNNSGGNEEGPRFWTKCMTIGPIERVRHPVAFWKEDELLLETEDHKIVSYSLSTQKVRKFPVDYWVHSKTAHAVICVKSLVSVIV